MSVSASLPFSFHFCPRCPIPIGYPWRREWGGQVRLGQVRQVMLGQVRLGQVMFGQVRLGQVRLGQVRLGQVVFSWLFRIFGTITLLLDFVVSTSSPAQGHRPVPADQANVGSVYQVTLSIGRYWFPNLYFVWLPLCLPTFAQPYQGTSVGALLPQDNGDAMRQIQVCVFCWYYSVCFSYRDQSPNARSLFS